MVWADNSSCCPVGGKQMRMILVLLFAVITLVLVIFEVPIGWIAIIGAPIFIYLFLVASNLKKKEELTKEAREEKGLRDTDDRF
jgi:amino acid permease